MGILDKINQSKPFAKEEENSKSILIIGLGRFGTHLCKHFSRLENEVMVVDQNEELLEDVLPYVVGAKIGDCTNEKVLDSLGVSNFDICFVCIGTNFQSSLEITSLLKEYGAKYVVSKASRDIHAKFLLRNGADEVIYPERDIAEKAAMRFSADHLFDYQELSDGYAIYETSPLPEWIGKSIGELDIRNTYGINILGFKSEGRISYISQADFVFHEGDHLLLMGHKDQITRILKRL